LGAGTGSAQQSGMRPISLVGVVLIVLGLVALVYQRVTYTKRDTIVDIGPIHATAEREHTVPLPPIVGIVSVAAGVVLLVAGRRRGS
jgi:hypothetical protein